MLLVKTTTGNMITKAELIRENPNVSLPKVWTDATLEALGAARVEKTDPPTITDEEVADPDGAELVGDVWRQKWVKREKYVSYTTTDDDGNEITVTAQQQRDADAADKAAMLAGEARGKRDDLLKETDHYGLSDVTMSDEMAAYRQALRDVPQQAGFPSTIAWPTKPE